MFDVKLTGTGNYQAVVTAMDYLSSMDDVAEIEAALKARLGDRKRASVILDMICPNGLSFNRFLSVDFNNGRLDEDSVDIVSPEEVDAQLQQQQIEFFRNSGVLLRSVLSRDAARTLLAGVH